MITALPPPASSPLTLHSRRQETTATTSRTSSNSLNSDITTITSPTSSASSPSRISSGSTTPSSSNVLTFSNLFPTPTNTPPPSNSRRGVSQTVLMWIFAVIAVGLLTTIMFWRYTCSKLQARRRRTRTEHGGLTTASRGWTGFGLHSGLGLSRLEPAHSVAQAPWGDDDRHQGSGRPIILSTSFLHSGLVPIVNQDGSLIANADSRRHHHHHQHHHHHHQRVRAADTDEGGRRGGGGERAVGYALEELPAYEAGKSPPGYHAAAFTPSYSPRDREGGDGVSPQSPPVIPYASRPGGATQAGNTENENTNVNENEGENRSSIHYRPSSSTSN